MGELSGWEWRIESSQEGARVVGHLGVATQLHQTDGSGQGISVSQFRPGRRRRPEWALAQRRMGLVSLVVVVDIIYNHMIIDILCNGKA